MSDNVEKRFEPDIYIYIHTHLCVSLNAETLCKLYCTVL